MIRTSGVTHGFVEVDGLDLHHVAFGGSGTPAICLHGVTGNAFGWHDVAAELGDRASLISLDMRGYGDSQWSPKRAYRTSDHVSDLEDIVDALGFERVTLLGSSWGGLVATSYAARHPDRVERLAIVDVEPSFEQSETDLFPRPHSYASIDDAIAYERSGNPHAADATLEVVAATVNRPGPDGTLVPKHDPFFYERWPFRADDHWDELPELTMPTLLVHARDSFVRGEVMERMAERIPRSELVHIDDSTHVVPIDNPTALAKHLGAFLGG
jgi:pimeloyl-ACP methyl ester carboxylesterase